jgi:hypothetical protein
VGGSEGSSFSSLSQGKSVGKKSCAYTIRLIPEDT